MEWIASFAELYVGRRFWIVSICYRQNRKSSVTACMQPEFVWHVARIACENRRGFHGIDPGKMKLA
jgi:hypothetical protein